jgi:hypothetical protein
VLHVRQRVSCCCTYGSASTAAQLCGVCCMYNSTSVAAQLCGACGMYGSTSVAAQLAVCAVLAGWLTGALVELLGTLHCLTSSCCMAVCIILLVKLRHYCGFQSIVSLELVG